MIIRWYFRIQGKPELLQKLRQLTDDEGFIELLSYPVLWIYNERGLNRITMEIIELEVKLLFLANLSCLYLSKNNDSAIVKPLRELLGTPPIKIEIFDQWWKIERYREYEIVQDVQEHIASEDLELFAETGDDFIDGWLKNLIAQKEAREKSN